jgi:hypothetical protein
MGGLPGGGRFLSDRVVSCNKQIPFLNFKLA